MNDVLCVNASNSPINTGFFVIFGVIFMSKRRRRSHRELSSQFSIRLFADQLASYEEKLAGSGVSITEYIRERLDGQDQVNEVLESVLERLSDIDQKLEQLSTKDKQK